MDFESIWSPAKVFSPTAAKQQHNQQQRDWAYVDQFLATRFAGSAGGGVPAFERNAETLAALLALAAANEAADEERALEQRVKEKALDELQRRDAAIARARSGKGEPLLAAVEDHLTQQGRRCLNSTALLSVALGSNSVDPLRLAERLVGLAAQEAAVTQQTGRIDGLHARLQAELAAARDGLRSLEAGRPEHALPADLATRVAEWTRTARHLRHKTEDYRDRLRGMQAAAGTGAGAGAGAGAGVGACTDAGTRAGVGPGVGPGTGAGGGGLTVPELVRQEHEVLALKEHVLGLEAQARGFQGLPPEKDLARLEVERVQGELEALEAARERLYDGMVH